MIRTLSFTLVLFGLSQAAVGCGDGSHTGNAPPDTETESAAPQIVVDPSVPQSCAEAEQFAQEGRASAVGCEFFTVSLDNFTYAFDYDLVLSNVHAEQAAHYSISASTGGPSEEPGSWVEIASGSIEPLEQGIIQLEPQHLYETPFCAVQRAMMRQGAYRIVSDVPLVAYQFHPLSAFHTADASLLLPVRSWSENHQFIGHRAVDTLQAGFFPDGARDFFLAYAAVVASRDGTEVTIDPAVEVRPARIGACGSPAVISGDLEPFTIILNAADVLFVHTDKIGDSLSGTTIVSNADHPIAVFTGHQCALVPDWQGGCDRLEEQLPGVEYWGTDFVAARMPNRNETNFTDPVMWQIAASEDDTTVRFEAREKVRGLPADEIVLQKGEVAEFYVYGSLSQPGDFRITASRPIGVLQYMTGFATTEDEDGNMLTWGDPSVAYVPPVDQFLLRYVVQVPEVWPENHLVITRRAGAPILVDDELVDDAHFQSVAGGGWEAGRVPVGHGTHIIASEDLQQPFGLIVVGLGEQASYAFTGGMGFVPINSPI